jgi:hypothetical protein
MLKSTFDECNCNENWFVDGCWEDDEGNNVNRADDEDADFPLESPEVKCVEFVWKVW